MIQRREIIVINVSNNVTFDNKISDIKYDIEGKLNPILIAINAIGNNSSYENSIIFLIPLFWSILMTVSWSLY